MNVNKIKPVLKVNKISEIDRFKKKKFEEVLKENKIMSERNLVAISIKHTEYRWKFGMPCTLWGSRTKDGENRSFGGYTENPYKSELYSLEDWQKEKSPAWIKTDCPVEMELKFCKKYKKFDTVLVTLEDYLSYCKTCGLCYEQ